MKLIKTILTLILSLVVFIFVLPFKSIAWFFKVIESISRVVKNTNLYLINQIKSEVLNNLTNGKEINREEGIKKNQ